MTDIAPELLKNIATSYNSYVSKDAELKRLAKLVNSSKATYAEGDRLAHGLGKALASAIQQNVSSEILPNGIMYYNIAEKVLPPLCTGVESTIADYAMEIQRTINDRAGLGINVVRPKHNADRMNGLVQFASSDEYDAIASRLGEAVINYEQNVMTETLKENARVQESLGIEAVVERIYDGVGLHDGKQPCQWCMDRAGVWTYSEANANGVFERHDGCGCIINYTVNGRTQTQTNWRHNEWTDV